MGWQQPGSPDINKWVGCMQVTLRTSTWHALLNLNCMPLLTMGCLTHARRHFGINEAVYFKVSK